MRKCVALMMIMAIIMTGCGQSQAYIGSEMPIKEKAEVTAPEKKEIPTPTLGEEKEQHTELEEGVEDWKVAYANCLNNIINNIEPICDSLEAFYYGDYDDDNENAFMKGTPYYAVIDMTNDDIPELVVSARTPGDGWLEYSVYQADGKTYGDPLTGMFAWDKDKHRIYCGHDLSTEAYDVSDGKIEYVESYVDYDGTWMHEEAGKEETATTEEAYEAFIKEAENAEKNIGIEFEPLTPESINKQFDGVTNGTYDDCMAAYKRVIENEQYPYELNRNPMEIWSNEYREYLMHYAFAHINDDDYPELVVYCENEDQPIFLLFSYSDGVILKNTNIFAYGNTPGCYVERKSVFSLKAADTNEMYGERFPYFNRTYYKLEGIELEPLVGVTSGMRPSYKDGEDGIPYKDGERSDSVLSIFDNTNNKQIDIKIIDDDISEWNEKDQIEIQNKAFIDNGLDKEFGFLPEQGKSFEYCSYEEILKKAQ